MSAPDSIHGLLLAGGQGSRLDPLTRSIGKHLLPVYNKPLIYYPLSVLMLAGIRRIQVISSPRDLGLLEGLLGDGGDWGLELVYQIQTAPRGLPEALILGEAFLGGARSCLILGDNFFYGQGLARQLRGAARITRGARIFAYPVQDPREYGVVAFNERGQAQSIEEKPLHPKSHYAVPGLYFYDGTAPARARALRPSSRGELEIADLNRSYLEDGQLEVEVLGRGVAWMDAGTPDRLLEAGNFVAALERRTGLRIACPEEIAWRQGWIDDRALARLIEAQRNPDDAAYLRAVLQGGRET